MNNIYIKKLHDIRFYSFVVSILLSLWSLYIDNVLNNDGILYIRTAELFSQGQWRAALDLYPWALYSYLISILSQISGLSEESAAYTLNSILFALSIVWFISIVRELGADNKTLIAAAVIVLAFPGINNHRSDVIREIGYLAFYLLALLYYIKYNKHPNWKYQITWIGSISIAALFRIEGFIFLLTMPFISWMAKKPDTVSRLRVMAIIAVIMSTAGIVVYSIWYSGFSASHLSDGSSQDAMGALQGIWMEMTHIFSSRLSLIQEHVLSKYSKEYAAAVLIATILIILFHSVFSKLTLVYTGMVAHAYYRKLVFPLPNMRYIWLGLLAINLIILAVAVSSRLFITSRWPLVMATTLLLATPFSLNAVYNSWNKKRSQAFRKNWVFPVVCGLIFLTGISGLDSFDRKSHIKEAGHWIKYNTNVNDTLLSNNVKLVYYSAKDAYIKNYDWQSIFAKLKDQKYRKFDYIALRIKRNEQQQESRAQAMFSSDPIARFTNKKGDAVNIYRIKKVEK